jgi:hypothetical protein
MTGDSSTWENTLMVNFVSALAQSSTLKEKREIIIGSFVPQH